MRISTRTPHRAVVVAAVVALGAGLLGGCAEDSEGPGGGSGDSGTDAGGRTTIEIGTFGSSATSRPGSTTST